MQGLSRVRYFFLNIYIFNYTDEFLKVLYLRMERSGRLGINRGARFFFVIHYCLTNYIVVAFLLFFFLLFFAFVCFFVSFLQISSSILEYQKVSLSSLDQQNVM